MSTQQWKFIEIGRTLIGLLIFEDLFYGFSILFYIMKHKNKLTLIQDISIY